MALALAWKMEHAVMQLDLIVHVHWTETTAGLVVDQASMNQDITWHAVTNLQYAIHASDRYLFRTN